MYTLDYVQNMPAEIITSFEPSLLDDAVSEELFLITQRALHES